MLAIVMPTIASHLVWNRVRLVQLALNIPHPVIPSMTFCDSVEAFAPISRIKETKAFNSRRTIEGKESYDFWPFCVLALVLAYRQRLPKKRQVADPGLPGPMLSDTSFVLTDQAGSQWIPLRRPRHEGPRGLKTEYNRRLTLLWILPFLWTGYGMEVTNANKISGCQSAFHIFSFL
jgi:hypothetical protein